MSELTAKRWEKGDGLPASHPPREALEVAMHRIASGEIDAKHVVVCIAEVGEGGACDVNFIQAGTFDHFAQIGLVIETADLMRKAAGS